MSLIDTGNQSLLFGTFILCALIVASREYYSDIYTYFMDKYTMDESYNTKVVATIAGVSLFITFLMMVGFKHYLVVSGSKIYMTEEYYGKDE